MRTAEQDDRLRAPRSRFARIAGRFAATPAWMLAGSLANELKHAVADCAGRLKLDESGDWLTSGLDAFAAEGCFLRFGDGGVAWVAAAVLK